jgi:hypothetical protein
MMHLDLDKGTLLTSCHHCSNKKLRMFVDEQSFDLPPMEDYLGPGSAAAWQLGELGALPRAGAGPIQHDRSTGMVVPDAPVINHVFFLFASAVAADVRLGVDGK